jgi:hypothetical protein
MPVDPQARQPLGRNLGPNDAARRIRGLGIGEKTCANHFDRRAFGQFLGQPLRRLDEGLGGRGAQRVPQTFEILGHRDARILANLPSRR